MRHAAEAALASLARPIVVVTGHERGCRRGGARRAGGRASRIIPPIAEGLASSLKAGVAALPESAAGALILLGDMPAVTPALIDRLIAAFGDRPDALAAAPIVEGRRGNPALLARALFPAIAALGGDEGARKLLDGARAGEDDRGGCVGLGIDPRRRHAALPRRSAPAFGKIERRLVRSARNLSESSQTPIFCEVGATPDAGLPRKGGREFAAPTSPKTPTGQPSSIPRVRLTQYNRCNHSVR